MKRWKWATGIVTLLLGIGIMTNPIGAEQYQYDSLNRVTQVVYEDGTVINYTYDANGNMTETRSKKYSQELEEEKKEPENNIKESDRKENQEIKIKVKTQSASYVIYKNSDEKEGAELTGTTKKNQSSFSIPASIRYEGKEYPVTAINDGAFKGNKKMNIIKWDM